MTVKTEMHRTKIVLEYGIVLKFRTLVACQMGLGLNIFISNQFIQYNTIVNHTNIRIRTEAKAFQVLLL